MQTYLYPKFYSSWLSKRIPLQVVESLATCDQCCMVNPAGLTRDPGPFLNHLKCCTYFPFLPNFSVGALLDSQISQVETSSMLLPVGLYPSVEYQEKKRSYGAKGFGQRDELICPFFDKQNLHCSIWQNRPGVCTSYFCKSNRGKEGFAFWAKVESYLNHFEWKLAKEILTRMGLTENHLAFCQASISLETEPEEREYFIQAAWDFANGQWLPQKANFFRETTKLAYQISAAEVGQLLDPEFRTLELELNSLVRLKN